MVTERSPQYISQAEALLGTRAYYDDEREESLHEGRLTFTAETAGMRGLLYVRALRLMAQAQLEARLNFENPMSAMRPSRIGKFALEHLQEVLDISRQLAVINAAEQTLNNHEESFMGGLRATQQPYMRDIISFLDMPEQKIEYLSPAGEPQTAHLRGALVEAPTGLGKTVLIARSMVAVGVGKPIESIEHDKGRVRALIIVPSQTIVEQMTGKVGDDTLRRFAPGVDVGAYYQFEKDHTADAVVITIDQFVDNFRHGMLFGERFDICIVDEAHTITQPLLLQTIVKHWRGGPIIGFTATPEYNQTKDARNILRHRIYHGGLLDYIESEEDVLNAAQLFAIRAEHSHYIEEIMLQRYDGMTEKHIDQMVIREATAEYLMPQIAEGRRGIIFCEQGGDEPSGFAKLMAERLSMLTKPDGTPLRVAVAGAINHGLPLNNPNHNTNIRRRYSAGELDFIITVEWGREGLNEDIDAVVTTGSVASIHKFLQEIGRGTRLSKRFPVTTYGHIFVPSKNPKALSLFGVFGFEDIEQGLVIGYKPPKSTPDSPSRPRGAKNWKDVPGAMDPRSFPLRIQTLIDTIEAKTVGEALFSTEIYKAVPKDYKRYEVIMDYVPGPHATIRRHLRDQMGFACIGRYNRTDYGREFIFYFEPATEAYLDKFRGAVARVDLQREFGGVDSSIVDAMAEEAQATSVLWFYHHGQQIPHFVKTDVEKIREVYRKTPPASPTDYTRAKLAGAAGIKKGSNIITRLTPAENARKIRKRTTTANGKIRILDHWEEPVANEIIARLKELTEAEGVPLYLVTRELAIRYIRTSRQALVEFADTIGEPAEIVRIGRGGRPPRCFTWAAIQRAANEFGTRHNLDIDFHRLPIAFNDKDPVKLAYAEEVIAKLAALSTAPGSRTK